jgi:hypothetical protein
MGCTGSKTTAAPRPAKKQSAKATLLQEPELVAKGTKPEVAAIEGPVVLANNTDCSADGANAGALVSSAITSDLDLQLRLRKSLDTALHDGSLSTAATSIVLREQEDKLEVLPVSKSLALSVSEEVEVLPVSEESIVEELAPAPTARFPWSCMFTACA